MFRPEKKKGVILTVDTPTNNNTTNNSINVMHDDSSTQNNNRDDKNSSSSGVSDVRAKRKHVGMFDFSELRTLVRDVGSSYKSVTVLKWSLWGGLWFSGISPCSILFVLFFVLVFFVHCVFPVGLFLCIFFRLSDFFLFYDSAWSRDCLLAKSVFGS